MQGLRHCNTKRSWRATLVVLLTLWVIQDDQVYYAKADDSSVLIWTSSGGGWRALIANMGFVNTFKKAGLIDVENKNCKFAAVASNSGTTWLMAQLFYSQPFIDKVLPEQATDIYQFSIDWMESFRRFVLNSSQKNLTKLDEVSADSGHFCQLVSSLGLFSPINDASALCSVFARSDFNWGRFIEGMLKTASTYAYNDKLFTSRIMSPENRVPIFNQTDLHIQLSVLPISNVRKSGRRYTMTYIGPNTNDTVFTVPIPAQYTVSSAKSSFFYGIDPSLFPLQVYTSQAPKNFRFSDYERFYLYNKDNNGSIFTSLPASVVKTRRPFTDPYNGVGTVAQVSAASSATLSQVAGTIPSFAAHRYSVKRFVIQESSMSNFEKRKRINRLQTYANLFYTASQAADFAVCSSWPGKCNRYDSRLIDGSSTDGPALALTIGQQQAKDTNDLNTLLKVILTNVNQMNDGNANLLSYFSTYFNQGIPPGGFVWAPGVIETEPIQKSPWQSMQVFEEYMDDESLLDTLSPVSKEYFPFANITTGSYDCTTIDNPAFGIKGGQKVRIFLIRLNSNIPSEVIAPSSIKKWQVPLAELARYVATDDELVARIQDFVSS